MVLVYPSALRGREREEGRKEANVTMSTSTPSEDPTFLPLEQQCMKSKHDQNRGNLEVDDAEVRNE